MKKLFLISIISLLNLSFSKEENLKFEAQINKKNEIIITVKKNKNNEDDILKKYNITIEDLKKLKISLEEFKKLSNEEIEKLLNGEKNENK